MTDRLVIVVKFNTKKREHMKKIILLLMLILVQMEIQAQESLEYTTDYCECSSSSFDIKAKISGFYPVSSKVRNIYHSVFCQVDLEISKTFCEQWQPWANVGYVWSSGHSLGLHDHTKLKLIPISAGVNYLFPIFCSLEGYVGIGASYNLLKIKDHSCYVHEHVHKNSWGYVVRLGLNYTFCEHLLTGLFVNYNDQRFHFKTSYSSPYVERNNLNLSSINFGVALGYRF